MHLMLRDVRLALLIAMVCLSLHSGCNRGPQLGEVKGRVTLDGKPVARAVVMFFPEGGGRPGSAKTDQEGYYELYYNPTEMGTLVGRHEVKITTFYPPADDFDPITGNLVHVPELAETLPKRYHANSELTAEVEPGMNIIDWELTSDGAPTPGPPKR